MRRVLSKDKKARVGEAIVDRFLFGRRRDSVLTHLTFQETNQTPAPECVSCSAAGTETLDIVRAVVIRIGDSRRIQHVHQAGEGGGFTVMRRGRCHDERVGAAGEQIGELGAQRELRTTECDIVGFVDDDDVPIALVRPNPELGVLFQGVDGNDGLVEIMEGVRVGGDSARGRVPARLNRGARAGS